MFMSNRSFAGRPAPSWVSPGAAFHIKPAAGWGWINGAEFPTFSSLIAEPSAASFSRASEAYALNSLGNFQRFDSGVPAITDLGLLVEPAESILNNNSIFAGTGATTSTGMTVEYLVPGPFGDLAYRLTCTGVSGTHSRNTIGAAVTINGDYFIYSIVESLSADFYQMVMSSSTFGTQSFANFTLSGSGTAGSKGTNTQTSGIQRLSTSRYLCWMTTKATATGTGTLTHAVVPASTSGRLATSTSTASLVISAAQISTATRWGSPFYTSTAPKTREAVALLIKPPAATYNLTYKFGDGTADQAANAIAISGSGYTIPSTLNGRFVTDIIGLAA